MVDRLGIVFAEKYAANSYDANRLGEMWNRDLTPDKRETEKENDFVFNQSNGNPVMTMLK